MHHRLLASPRLGAFLACATAARAEETLFAQIGGEAKLKATVDTLVEVMLDDERINFTFAQTDLTKFKTLLYDQICELTGGPCKYTGRDMSTRTRSSTPPTRSSTRWPKTCTSRSRSMACRIACRTR